MFQRDPPFDPGVVVQHPLCGMFGHLEINSNYSTLTRFTLPGRIYISVPIIIKTIFCHMCHCVIFLCQIVLDIVIL